LGVNRWTWDEIYFISALSGKPNKHTDNMQVGKEAPTARLMASQMRRNAARSGPFVEVKSASSG